MKNPKLKPCPFCGGKVVFYKNNADSYIGTQCKSKTCGATVIFFPGGCNKSYGSKELIAEYFNNRSIE